MIEPITWAVALGIAKLACSQFFESSVGKLGEKFTEGALQKIDELYQKIRGKLSGSPNAAGALTAIEQGKEEEIQRLAVYLQDAMTEDPSFADQVQALEKEIQAGKIQDNSSMVMNIDGQNNTGYLTKNEVSVYGGESYTGQIKIEKHYHDKS